MSDNVVQMQKTIPAREAVILWGRDDDGLPNEKVAVVRKGAPEIKNWEDYPASLGAICSGWCEADGPPRSNPEGVFASVVLMHRLCTPASQVVRPWLEQFAKIDECEWARRMLAEMESLRRRVEEDQSPHRTSIYSVQEMVRLISEQRPDYRVKIEFAGVDVLASVTAENGPAGAQFTGKTVEEALHLCIQAIDEQTGERFLR